MIFVSPFQDVWETFRTNQPSARNPLPYPWIAANCLAWTFYGAYTRDPFVYFGNIIGYLLGLWYTLVSLPHGNQNFRMLTAAILLGSAFLSFVGGFISFTILKGADSGKTILGVVCVIILTFFYSSPLSSVADVVKNRDSSSINPFLAASSFINSCLGTTYGFVLSDPFIWGSNLLGALLSIVQLVLWAAYRRPSGPRRVSLTGAMPVNSDDFEDEGQRLYDMSPKSDVYSS